MTNEIKQAKRAQICDYKIPSKFGKYSINILYYTILYNNYNISKKTFC